jgi:hypothetical protein
MAGWAAVGSMTIRGVGEETRPFINTYTPQVTPQSFTGVWATNWTRAPISAVHGFQYFDPVAAVDVDVRERRIAYVYLSYRTWRAHRRRCARTFACLLPVPAGILVPRRSTRPTGVPPDSLRSANGTEPSLSMWTTAEASRIEREASNTRANSRKVMPTSHPGHGHVTEPQYARSVSEV